MNIQKYNMQLGSKEIGFGSLIVLIFLLFVFALIHEVIHGLVIPLKDEKGIWKTKSGEAMFIYSSTHVTKIRFICVIVAPLIILGVIPILIAILGYSLFSFQTISVISCFGVCGFLTAVGDIYNVKLTMQKVPNNAYIYNKGIQFLLVYQTL